MSELFGSIAAGSDRYLVESLLPIRMKPHSTIKFVHQSGIITESSERRYHHSCAMNEQSGRTYQAYNPAAGYPAGENLFYECTLCGKVTHSLPKESFSCACSNLMIDVDYGRVTIKNHSAVRLFSAAP